LQFKKKKNYCVIYNNFGTLSFAIWMVRNVQPLLADMIALRIAAASVKDRRATAMHRQTYAQKIW